MMKTSLSMRDGVIRPEKAFSSKCGIGGVVRRVALEVARGREVEAGSVVDSLDNAELDTVMRTARAEGLLPLVAAAVLYSERHPEMRERAQGWTREAIRRDLAVDRLLRMASDALKRSRIPFLWMKGACFRDALYPATWMRTMTDVDLLVRRFDLEQTVRALEEAGFRVRSFYPTRPFSARYSLERQLDAPQGGLVEVHAGFTYEPFGLTVDLDKVFARALRTSRGLIPSWEDHLLIVAIHQARTGMLAGVRPFLDVARLIETCPLDWAAAAKRARDWGCSAILYYALEAVRCLFGTLVPTAVLAHLGPSGARAVLLRALVLRGAGDPVGGRLRAGTLRVAPAIVFNLWRPGLYALLLDRHGPRAAFLTWIAGARTADHVMV